MSTSFMLWKLDQHPSHPLEEVRLPSVQLDRLDGGENLEVARELLGVGV